MNRALEHYREYTRLERELHSGAVRRAVAVVQMRAELERTERELLRAKAERLEQEVLHREHELAAALHLTQKSRLLSRIEERMAPYARSRWTDASEPARALLPDIRESIDGRAQWQALEEQFRGVHPEFITMLIAKYPSLTQTEIKVCALMKINLTTKDITDILRTSPRTVEGHRRFIRRKMSLGRDENLSTFLAALPSRTPTKILPST